MRTEPIDNVPADKVRTEVLVAWLYEAANGGVGVKGMKRLCWLAAEKLSKPVEPSITKS